MQQDNEYFKGTVKLYNEEFYIDANTGEGLERAIKKIDPLLCKMASKTYISGCSFDDIKQELAIMAINGIRAYDGSKNVKLSTFLHIHLNNKLGSKIRSDNKMANDADNSSISYTADSEKCECGGKFLKPRIGSPKQGLRRCDSCGKISHRMRRIKGEVPFSYINSKRASSNSDDSRLFEHSIAESGAMFMPSMTSDGKAAFLESMRKLNRFMDEKTYRVLELICLEDYSIKDAAEEVGLNGWAVSIRLKKLARNKHIRDMFNM